MKNPMNCLLCLLLVTIGTESAKASTIEARFQLHPNAFVELAGTDASGNLVSFAANDTDGDGIVTVIGDLNLNEPVALGEPDMDDPIDIKVNGATGNGSTLPLLAELGGKPLIGFLFDDLIPVFTIGQTQTVVGGQIPGFDARIYEHPGSLTPIEALSIDLSSLPLYSGPATVTGLVTTSRVVPEPSTFACSLLGLTLTSACWRKRKKKLSQA